MATTDIGRQVKYGIGKETTQGTPVAATNWIPHLGFELNPKNEIAKNDSAYGVIEKTNESTILRSWAEGSLEAKLTADTGGLLLLGAFGSVSTADNADTNPVVKDHTFTINQDTAGQSFTFIRKDTLSTVRYALSRIGKFELAMELDDYVKLTADIMAKKGSTTTATPAYTSETEFVPKHMSVKVATSEAGLGAATAVAAVQSFTLTVDPNLRSNFSAGSGDPESFTSEGFEIQFEMEARYTDQVFENAFNNGTTLALQITANNTDVTIGASAHPQLVVTAPKMNITDWARTEDLDSPITQTMTGTIHYSAADARAIRAVLTNTTASY
jgi:hypothetical protein